MSKKIISTEEFGKFTEEFWANNQKPFAFGIGEGYYDEEDNLIAVKWLTINLNDNHGTAAVLLYSEGLSCAAIVEMYFEPFLDDGCDHANIAALEYLGDEIPVLQFYYSEEELTQNPPESIGDVHFRHALMSRQHYAPNTLNLNGQFNLLPRLVWCITQPFTVDYYNNNWYLLQAEGKYPIGGVDFFPPMTMMNPMPEGVRITNPTMIRNGAHLAPGTTQMHYGFCNANAGTLGKTMLEGNIPMGVVVGNGSDIGAGSGSLGTLSGGNEIIIKIGKNCLIGTRAENGIPIGDNVCIAAGVVFTGNTPVEVVEWKKAEDGKFETDTNGKVIEVNRKTVKAIELTDISDVTFRRASVTKGNSIAGTIEVIPVPNKAVLNEMLHVKGD